MEARENGRHLSRRTVVAGGAGIAALLVLGGAGKALAADEGFLRPPGGQDYEQFLGACVRCDRCRSACTREVISVCTGADGLLNMRLPKLNFQHGFCDLCEGEYRCVAACPTGALSPFDPAVHKIGVAAVDPNECLTYHISGRCDARCIGACPEEALYLDNDGRLQIEEDKCYGCGACQYVCPSNAYGSYSGTGLRGVNVWPKGVA